MSKAYREGGLDEKADGKVSGEISGPVQRCTSFAFLQERFWALCHVCYALQGEREQVHRAHANVKWVSKRRANAAATMGSAAM